MISSLENTLTLPVRTLVAQMLSLSGQRAMRSASKSTDCSSTLAQRIEVERVELIGRHQPRHHVEHHEGRRMLERARCPVMPVEQASAAAG